MEEAVALALPAGREPHSRDRFVVLLEGRPGEVQYDADHGVPFVPAGCEARSYSPEDWRYDRLRGAALVAHEEKEGARALALEQKEASRRSGGLRRRSECG